MPASPTPTLLSIVLPAYNEGEAITPVLKALQAVLKGLPCRAEVVVVDDGSADDTAARARSVPGVRVISNPINLGYGHSLLRGIAASDGDVIGIADADGTYPVAEIPALLQLIERGADHVIGLRTGEHFRSHFSLRHFYRFICRYVVGQAVPDANSGLRLFRREVVESLRGDLCLGFSFTTSLTLASMLTGYVVAFREIPYAKRVGRSHVRPRDVLRTLQYLFQLIAVYNPLKLYLPLVTGSLLLSLAALVYGLWLERIAGLISAVILLATTLLLVGISAHAYIVSRVGLYPVRRRGLIASGGGHPAGDSQPELDALGLTPRGPEPPP